MIAWDAVTTNACGGPADDIAGYQLLDGMLWPVDWTMTEEGPMPVYPRPIVWRLVAETTETRIEYEAPVPPVGGVTYYRVRAVDLAGNDSDRGCA